MLELSIHEIIGVTVDAMTEFIFDQLAPVFSESVERLLEEIDSVLAKIRRGIIFVEFEHFELLEFRNNSQQVEII